MNQFQESSFFGEPAVYIIFTEKSEKDPAYIGHGNLLSRLAYFQDNTMDSNDQVESVLVGFLDDPSDYESDKEELEIVEAALLLIAQDVDRWPIYNSVRGAKNKVAELFYDHGKVRITISGVVPIRLPSGGKDGKFTIDLEWDEEQEDFVASHPWRSKREAA